MHRIAEVQRPRQSGVSVLRFEKDFRVEPLYLQGFSEKRQSVYDGLIFGEFVYVQAPIGGVIHIIRG